MKEALQNIIMYIAENMGWLWGIIITFVVANSGAICAFLVTILKNKTFKERMQVLIAQEIAKNQAKLTEQEKENNAKMREELISEVKLLKSEMQAYIKSVKEENEAQVENRTENATKCIENIIKSLE